MMKSLVVLFALVSSSATWADDGVARNFDFTFYGNQSGSFSMVSCDYAEWQAQRLFDVFGASRVSTSCSGGIMPNGMIMPLQLRVRYTPVELGESTRTVRADFRNQPGETAACTFNSRMVRAAVRVVKNVKIASARDACFDPTRDWSFRFSVTLPN